MLFSRFGVILDVVALKTERMRGQAWVSFVMIQSATDAMNVLQGFDFYGKPMVFFFVLRDVQHITYSKTKSHAVERFEDAVRKAAT